MQVQRAAKYKEEGSPLEDVASGQVIAKTSCWKQIINYNSLSERVSASEIMEAQYCVALILCCLPLFVFNNIPCLIKL